MNAKEAKFIERRNNIKQLYLFLTIISLIALIGYSIHLLCARYTGTELYFLLSLFEFPISDFVFYKRLSHPADESKVKEKTADIISIILNVAILAVLITVIAVLAVNGSNMNNGEIVSFDLSGFAFCSASLLLEIVILHL